MVPSPDCSPGHQRASTNLAASSSLDSLICPPPWDLLLYLDVVPRNLCSGMLWTLPSFIKNREMLLDGLIIDVWLKRELLASPAHDPPKAGLWLVSVWGSHWFIRQCDVCARRQPWPASVNGGVGQTKAKEGHRRGEGWWWAKGEMRELCRLNLLPFKN